MSTQISLLPDSKAGQEPLVFLKDRMVPASQASIAIYDAGIILGATVTDMTRTFHHRPFRLEDHIDRFYRSARYTRIRPPFDRDRMEEISRELIRHNAKLLPPDRELSLVHFMTAGEIASYSALPGTPKEMVPTLCIHTFPLPFEAFTHLFTEGAHVVTPSIRHYPPQCVDSKIKHRSRMNQWLADQETHQVDPRAITLLLDLDGNVTETSGSNFAIVQDGAVVAPSARNTLQGVSLLTVSELCAELGIPFEQRDFQVYDVMNADEALLLTTPYCIAPVNRINGATIGDGKAGGPVFRRLMDAWSERAGLDIIAQITGRTAVSSSAGSS